MIQYSGPIVNDFKGYKAYCRSNENVISYVITAEVFEQGQVRVVFFEKSFIRSNDTFNQFWENRKNLSYTAQIPENFFINAPVLDDGGVALLAGSPGAASKYAYRFNGVDEFINLSDTNKFNILHPEKEFSVVARIKTTDRDGRILTKGSYLPDKSGNQFGLYIRAGRLGGNVGGEGTTSSYKVDDGLEHVIAITNGQKEGAGHEYRFRLIVDGLAVKERRSGTNQFSINTLIGAAYGSSAATSIRDLYAGTLDDLCIFNTCLHENDIAQFVNGGKYFSPLHHSSVDHLICWLNADFDQMHFPTIKNNIEGLAIQGQFINGTFQNNLHSHE